MMGMKYNMFFKTKKSAREFLAACKSEGYDLPIKELEEKMGIESKEEVVKRTSEQKLLEQAERVSKKNEKVRAEEEKKSRRLEKKEALKQEVIALKAEFPETETDEITDELNMGGLRLILKTLNKVKRTKAKEEGKKAVVANDADPVAVVAATVDEMVSVAESHEDETEVSPVINADERKATKATLKKQKKEETAEARESKRLEKEMASVSKKAMKNAVNTGKDKLREEKKEALKQEVLALKTEFPETETDEITDELNMGQLTAILKILKKAAKQVAKQAATDKKVAKQAAKQVAKQAAKQAAADKKAAAAADKKAAAAADKKAAAAAALVSDSVDGVGSQDEEAVEHGEDKEDDAKTALLLDLGLNSDDEDDNASVGSVDFSDLLGE
jgi:hypothetical protein